MSNVKFLVFEGGNTVLDMEKMSVFKNGQDMPWSYYEADVDTSQGMKHFMYTSKSSPGPNGENCFKILKNLLFKLSKSKSKSTLISELNSLFFILFFTSTLKRFLNSSKFSFLSVNPAAYLCPPKFSHKS